MSRDYGCQVAKPNGRTPYIVEDLVSVLIYTTKKNIKSSFFIIIIKLVKLKKNIKI